MKVGSLGGIVFQVSGSTVETIRNYQRSGSARYQEHQRHAAPALTEFVGVNAETISFEIELSAYLGVNVENEFRKILDYTETGKAVFFVLGDYTIGRWKWVIKSYKATAKHFDGRGNIVSETVSLSLLEYQKS